MTGPGEAGALAERLAAMEERLAAAEVGVARAEADREGWKKVREQLQAALARVEGGGVVSAGKIAAAVRAEAGPQLATLAKRLDAVEAAQSALREALAELRGSEPPAKAAEVMMVGKAVGKIATRVAIIERDLRAFSKGIAGMPGDDE